jgi:hypothetical protein
MQHIPSAPEVSLHELGIQLIASQAGEGPEDDSLYWLGFLSGKEEQILQTLAPHSGRPGSGLIGEHVD